MKTGHTEYVPVCTSPAQQISFLTRNRSLITLISLIMGNFIAASVASLQGPFFPAEAEKKGAKASQYGLIFAVYPLVIFVMSPIAGKLVAFIPTRFLLCCGIFILGTCCILFGILSYAPYGRSFLALAFAIRIVEGIGAAAYITTSYTIIASQFQGNVGTTFATVGAFYGVGLIVGPTIGGALYELGGYTLPFAVVGSLMVVYSVVAFPLLPPAEPAQMNERIGMKETLTFWLHFSTLVPSGCITVNFIMIGFNSAILEPHIRQFSLSPFLVGLVFVISGGVYGITAPIWGYITDKWVSPKVICLAGTICSCIFLLFVGPAPFFPFNSYLWMVISSLVFFGFGSGTQYVGAFSALKKDTKSRGYPENMAIHGLVSSVFATSQSLGSFIGPSLGGFLYDAFEYRTTTMFFLAVELFMVCVTSVYVIQERRMLRASKKQDIVFESASLLSSNKTVY